MVNRKVSGGTISNILSRLIRKGIICRERKDRGVVYKLLVEDFNIVRTGLDTSRIRFHGFKRLHDEEKNKDEEPYAVRLAFERVLDIKFSHGVLPAAIFLAHTLAGARDGLPPVLERGHVHNLREQNRVLPRLSLTSTRLLL